MIRVLALLAMVTLILLWPFIVKPRPSECEVLQHRGYECRVANPSYYNSLHSSGMAMDINWTPRTPPWRQSDPSYWQFYHFELEDEEDGR